MKIYATRSLTLDRFVGKDVWVLATLGVHDRLWQGHPLHLYVNDRFELHSWIHLISQYHGDYDGYVFNYIYAEPFADAEYFPPKSYMAENYDKLMSNQHIASSGEIRLFSPMMVYSTEELFGGVL